MDCPGRPGNAKTRDVGLDGIKVVATLLVIFIHVSGVGFAAINHPQWAAVNFYESISRVCVPLFFMVTGALLLPKTPTVRSILKRIWRVSLALVAWSFIYLIYSNEGKTPVAGWFAPILENKVVPHFWFLYALIGIYLSLPVLVGFFRLNDVSLQFFCLAFWFLCSSAMMLFFFLTSSPVVGVNYSSLVLYGGYAAAGALLYWKLKFTTAMTWALAIVAVASAAGTYMLTKHISMQRGGAVEIFLDYSSPLVLTGTLSSFVAIKAFFNRVALSNETFKAIVTALSNVSFGIYLVHPMVIWTLAAQGAEYRLYNYWYSIPLVSLLVFAASAGITAMLKRIPILRQIVS